MSGRMSRTKGAGGERELLRWFGATFAVAPPKRNLGQTRGGGADCVELPGIALEIKRQEVLQLNAWWAQAVQQAVALGGGRMPVLAYRRNRHPWRFALPASLIVPGSWGYMLLEQEVFTAWYRSYLRRRR